jgi:hypothetical protein
LPNLLQCGAAHTEMRQLCRQSNRHNPLKRVLSHVACACRLHQAGDKMDEYWAKPDLLFLRSSLARGMSFAEAARFLCRDKDEVRRKATELGLSRACAAARSVPPMVVPAVRRQIKEAQRSIQKAGIPSSIERCRLLLARIDAALLKTRSEHFVNIAPVAQGALERAALVLRRCSRPSS